MSEIHVKDLLQISIKAQTKHEQELAEIKLSFSEEIEQLNIIISEMGLSLYYMKKTVKDNSQDLLETFLDKDVTIRELEEKN